MAVACAAAVVCAVAMVCVAAMACVAVAVAAGAAVAAAVAGRVAAAGAIMAGVALVGVDLAVAGVGSKCLVSSSYAFERLNFNGCLAEWIGKATIFGPC